MANSINDFWKILEEIQGTSTDLTESIKAISKHEKTISESMFVNIIDQIAYNSQDYQRLRQFIRDWYATHRTITSYQANISDVYQMPNDQLDDLFQSFGYDLSSSLKDPISNEAPLTKVNFFLDLVNLYKIKGTPKALLNILQYYGISEVDIYEMSLQYEDREDKNENDLVFKGKVVTGTTGDTSNLYLPFDLLTQSDPHWFQTESQIRNLVTLNKINFPSQSPYFAIKPKFDEEAIDASTGIIQRELQNYYATWETAGFPSENTTPVLDQDAVITITGDQCSFLTLYLASVYIFNKDYNVGSYADRFICYDGTNIDAIDIIDEFRTITDKPTTRFDLSTAVGSQYSQYLDTFTRETSTHFLQTHSDAGIILNQLNPTVKYNLDNLAVDNNTILGTLLRDMGEWVRSNISYGFINMSYILFGIDSLFSQLRDVIEFFKPYRARLVPLEMMQFKNRLLNTIVTEDDFSFYLDFEFSDYLVGDSEACCLDDSCLQYTHPREYYDCGSYYDIGAVTDEPTEIQIDFIDTYNEYLKCPTSDTTGYVTWTIDTLSGAPTQAVNASSGLSIVDVEFDSPRLDTNYAIQVNVFNEVDDPVSMMPYIVTQKTVDGFRLKFSDQFDAENYYVTWNVDDQTSSYGIQYIDSSSSEITVTIPTQTNPYYSLTVALENVVDSSAAIYLYTITNKTTNSFTVKFSDVMNSPNYRISWTVADYARTASGENGWINVPNGLNEVTVLFSTPQEDYDNYNVSFVLVNTDTTTSFYSYIVTSKDPQGFTVKFSDIMDSDTYYLSWVETVPSSDIIGSFEYRQIGGMRDFDIGGTFDCTYAFDEVFIQIEESIRYMAKESGDLILQENGDPIIV